MGSSLDVLLVTTLDADRSEITDPDELNLLAAALTGEYHVLAHASNYTHSQGASTLSMVFF
jgi:hypothetical protein